MKLIQLIPHLFGIPSTAHFVAFKLQLLGDQFPNASLIIQDQDSRHYYPPILLNNDFRFFHGC
jgi:hypothetical protein